MAEQGIASQLLPAQGQLLGTGLQLRQMLLAHRQLAGQLLALALALNVLVIEPLPLELEAAGALRQLTQNARHLRLALVIGVLLGTAQRAGFTIAQDVSMLLEAGDGAGLLQRVTCLVPLQGEPLTGRRQLVAEDGQLAERLLQLGYLLLQATMLLAVIATIVGQLQQLAQLTQLFGLLLPLLLRLGQAPLPLLLLQLVLLLLQPGLLTQPVVALLLPLLKLVLQLPEGTQLVLAQGKELLQPVGIFGPILHGGEQGLPLAGHRRQLLVLLKPSAPLLVLGLELLHLLALLVPALLQGELHLPLLRSLLLDLLQLLLLFPNAGIELLRPLELGLQGAPLALGGDLLCQQLLLGEGALLGLLLQLAKFGAELGQQFLLLLHLQGEAGQLVVIGAGHLGLLGAGEFLALGGGRTVGHLCGGKGRLPLLTGLQLGGDAAIEVA